ncbi:hypothetical protein CC80DRAFT_37553 [Byssothecium circinans]|uniref:Uncharacterized protein n=1 Tax=Byssothecium circinans TaxID=147558 RepID=A0A6A5U0X5_9PLEO|nr:hypothetical protein CC80DRAFT_37553 [Byssothecium circinans]
MPSHLSERPNDGTRRSSVSHNAENPQHWYYVWDETEKRYDVLYESKQKAPPTDHQLDSRMAPNPVQHSSSSPSLQPNTNAHQGPSYEGNARPPHHPNPLRREEFWRRSGKGGRTDGAAHPGPPSPMRSPPSPWIKDSRTLPPLRPSPSKASFSQTQDSTMVDVGVQPTSSPALQQPVPTLLAGILGHDSPYRNVGDSNSQKPRALFGPEHDHRRFQQGPNAVTVGAGKDGTSRSVPAHREQQLMVGRDGTHNEELHWRKATEDSQKEAANNVVDDLTRRSSVERASAGVKSSSFSRPPPAMHAPFQDERTPQTPLEATPRSLFTSDSLWSNARHPDGSKTFPLVSPVSIHPRSQPTSPSTSSTLRTYPNPIDPHRPAREQPLRRPSQNIESTADARKQDVVANISYPLLLPRVAKEARQRVKDKSEHSQDVEIVPSRKSSEQLTVEASAKRKMVEDGTQVEEAGREQSANASLPNSKRKKFEAEEGSARNSERTKVDGKQALVDTGGKVLLREHSEPTSLS